MIGFVFDLSLDETEMLKGLTPEARTWREIPNPKFGGSTPRRVLQHIGTEGFRVINPYVWANKLKSEIRNSSMSNPDYKCVISGTRFIEEATATKDLGGKIWFIKRPGYGCDKTHESERVIGQLEGVADVLIDNDSTLEALERKVLEALYSTVRGL